MRDFDHFCVLHFPESDSLTEEICFAWATKKATEGNNTFRNPIVYLHGKGRKTRTVPLMPKTVQYCKQYLRKFHPSENEQSEASLFYTTIHGVQQKMSPDTVAVFFKKYGKKARMACAEVPEHLHPHMIRHTRAMHLYQSGMPMVLLSQYLGHAQVETTMIYAYADTEMKRAAIRKADVLRKGQTIPDEIWAGDEQMHSYP